MKTEIGISERKLKSSAVLLAKILSNEMTLYVKTRKAHWNVSGNSFMELHKLYESQYKQLEEFIDELAERISKLGHPAIGTMKEFMELTSIREYPGKYLNSKEMLKELLGDHQLVIIDLRLQIDVCKDKNNDAGTSDFLTGLMEAHETIAWTIRRYLN